jgi:hypothetical protein
MKTELSPRSRTLVSGLAAVATTALLMTTLVESLNPAALTRRSDEPSTQLSAAPVDARSHALLIRKV